MLFRFMFPACLVCSFFVTASSAQEPVPWAANDGLVAKLSAKNDFNYDESKVAKFELPDPLRMNDGTPVTSAKQWLDERRPELMEFFRSQVYGRRPSVSHRTTFEMVLEKNDALDGAATAREMKATIAIDDRRFSFQFTVFVPNHSTKKVPAIVLINNREATSIVKVSGEGDPMWPVKRMIERGYATASFFTSDVDPDDKDGYMKGIRSFFAEGGKRAPDAWGSLSAWGFGASVVLDYLNELDSVEASKVAVVGHSRGGKAAMWAASEDPRFAVAYSNNSGCGGAALSRRAFGETVARITTAFPHWFCENFAGYSGREGALPIDQHELVACVAPRAVYVTSADEDLWADPRGEYLSLVSAASVYKLLGENSINDNTMPPINSPRRVGKTGYHIRTGGHGLFDQDWDAFFEFFEAQISSS